MRGHERLGMRTKIEHLICNRRVTLQNNETHSGNVKFCGVKHLELKRKRDDFDSTAFHSIARLQYDMILKSARASNAPVFTEVPVITFYGRILVVATNRFGLRGNKA